MMKKKRLLFLDFDGVLHPNFCDSSQHFCKAGSLLETLERCAVKPEIIISSSWRFHYSQEEILGRLPAKLERMVTGFTPEVSPGPYQRYREIQAYLNLYSPEPDWRALDDESLGFLPKCTQLIVCKGGLGVDPEVMCVLQKWLV